MIHLIAGGDRTAEAIAECAECACSECAVPEADVLRRRQVTRDVIEQSCSAWQDKLVCFWGHGNDENKDEGVAAGIALKNMHGHWVIDVDNVVSFAHTAGLFAIACHAAKVLGPKAVEAGLRFFIGFVDRFRVVLYADPSSSYPLFSKPLAVYKSDGDAARLGRLALADLQDFIQHGLRRAGNRDLHEALSLVLRKDGSMRDDSLRTLPPPTQDGILIAAAGSLNWCNYKVIHAPPPATAS